MQLLLGLFFFSILLTTGSSIQCSTCIAINGYCSGGKKECPAGFDVCMTFSFQSKKDPELQGNFESCATEETCKQMKDLKGKPPSEEMAAISGLLGDAIIKEVVCSKAPPSFASFFPAFLGLLLMKLLF